MRKRQKILAVVGPTAVGKSSLAVRLARHFNGEIISADSRQVYRGLDIGTGKITMREMQNIPHYLLDVANPKKQFTVVQYIEKARRAIEKIARRGKLPILVGGTGFYISALLGDETIPDVPPNKVLRRRLSKRSVSELFRMLQMVDPNRANKMNESDRQNARRLIRAIEVAKASKVSTKPSTKPLYDPVIVGITLPNEKLHARIRARLVARLKLGMTAEAKHLHRQGLTWKRMEELGLEYRYLARYLQGKMSREEMIQKLETEIWHYAKRQMTWFKRKKNIKWFQPTEMKKLTKNILTFCRM